MSARWNFGDIDEEGYEVAVCIACDGSGIGDHPEFDEDGEETGHNEPCPVCCGFGRLDW